MTYFQGGPPPLCGEHTRPMARTPCWDRGFPVILRYLDPVSDVPDLPAPCGMKGLIRLAEPRRFGLSIRPCRNIRSRPWSNACVDDWIRANGRAGPKRRFTDSQCTQRRLRGFPYSVKTPGIRECGTTLTVRSALFSEMEDTSSSPSRGYRPQVLRATQRSGTTGDCPLH